MAAVASVASAVAVLGLLLVGIAGAVDSSALLTWTKLSPTAAPPARQQAAMAFDAATGTTVLFGGQSGNQTLDDTWTWDGATWTPQAPLASPPALAAASMAYDNIGHRIILFGGVMGDGTASGATWAWDGTTWAQLATTVAPPARYQASMAGDSLTGTDVLFGGLSVPGSALNDTWSWNGTNWTNNLPPASPPARSGAAETFDAVHGVVVLFGGATGPTNLADTWTWNGANWSPRAPATAPPARNGAAFGFDPGTETSVLFGGTGANGAALGDTWLWNGTTWSTSLPLSLLPVLSPPARTGAALANAPGNQRLVLFGGQSAGVAPFALGDTWRVATLVSGPSHNPSTTTVPAGGTSTTDPGSTTSSTTVAPGSSSTSDAPTSTPTTKAAPPPAPLAVTSRSVQRGDDVTVSGSGFVPGATITITLHSVSVVVGTTIADAQGRFSTTVLVPTDVPPGTHHLEATGAAQTGGQAVLVAQVSVRVPAGKHGGWLLPAFMVALTILLAAGAGVVLTASTRGHPRPS